MCVSTAFVLYVPIWAGNSMKEWFHRVINNWKWHLIKHLTKSWGWLSWTHSLVNLTLILWLQKYLKTVILKTQQLQHFHGNTAKRENSAWTISVEQMTLATNAFFFPWTKKMRTWVNTSPYFLPEVSRPANSQLASCPQAKGRYLKVQFLFTISINSWGSGCIRKFQAHVCHLSLLCSSSLKVEMESFVFIK